MNVFSSDLEAAQILWDYMRLNQPLTRTDAIVVAGSYDFNSALYAAELYQQGWAPLLVMSGGVRPQWFEPSFDTMTEAEVFAALAIKNGVPKHAILIENHATNTGENLLFSLELLQKNHYPAQTILLVQQPSFERRLLATAKHHFPQKQFSVTSRAFELPAYLDLIGKQRALNSLVGDFQRMETYRDLYLVNDIVPAHCWPAFDYLTQQGFTSLLMEPAANTLQRVGYVTAKAAA